jgi:glycerol-3-phosphate dehydrogenase subunit C
MCVNYCGSFPELFKRASTRDIDAGRAEGAEKIDDADIKAVATSAGSASSVTSSARTRRTKGASELLDFPRLMARERPIARRDGIPWSIASSASRSGSARSAPGDGPAVELRPREPLVRKVQEKVTGISASSPCRPWPARPSAPGCRAAASRWREGTSAARWCCSRPVTASTTRPGGARRGARARAQRVCVRLSGQRGRSREGLTCCGMPNLDGGDVAAARRRSAQRRAAAAARARGADDRRAGAVVRLHDEAGVGEYVPTPEVKEVAAATLDLMEFLVTLGKAKKLKREFPGLGNGRVSRGVSPARAEDRLPGARARRGAGDRGRRGRGVLGGGRHLGDEGGALRDRPQVRAEARRRGRRRRSPTWSSATARWRGCGSPRRTPTGSPTD